MNTATRQEIGASEFTEQEIEAAQFAFDHHPDWSPFWDSPTGREAIEVGIELDITPATTREWRNAWHREQMHAARAEDES